MIGAIRKSSTRHGLLAVMLLLALAVRAIVPAGYMPVQTSIGIIVTLCSGDGPQQIAIDIPVSKDQGDHQDAPQDKASFCIFAAMASGALVASVAAQLTVPALLLREIVLPPPAQTPPPASSFPILPPLRGPPPVA